MSPFLFQPILPDDELPLPERLVAVGHGAAIIFPGSAMDETDLKFRKMLKKRWKILLLLAKSRWTFDTDDDGERDYSELIEYIRIAVQLIFYRPSSRVSALAQSQLSTNLAHSVISWPL